MYLFMQAQSKKEKEWIRTQTLLTNKRSIATFQHRHHSRGFSFGTGIQRNTQLRLSRGVIIV